MVNDEPNARKSGKMPWILLAAAIIFEGAQIKYALHREEVAFRSGRETGRQERISEQVRGLHWHLYRSLHEEYERRYPERWIGLVSDTVASHRIMRRNTFLSGRAPPEVLFGRYAEEGRAAYAAIRGEVYRDLVEYGEVFRRELDTLVMREQR